VVAVSSTLQGRSVLPHRIRWEAQPTDPNRVEQVDFLIDSQLAWTERNAPYVYGDDGNWLVTSFLPPGRHRFETRLVTSDAHTFSDTVVATVPDADEPPMPVSGHWTRVVTTADTATATSGAPPPVGLWSLTIDDVGWSLSDPAQGRLRTDVAYPAAGHLVLRPTIETPPYSDQSHGAFCHEPDPEGNWTYTVRDNGRTLTLQPAAPDPCGDRTAVLRGQWTRTATYLDRYHLRRTPGRS
jgi:hypothetical protein